jgi:hypothetical protein
VVLELDLLAGFHRKHLDAGIAERVHVLLRRSDSQWMRAVVHRDGVFRLQHFPGRIGGVLRVHGEVAELPEKDAFQAIKAALQAISHLFDPGQATERRMC